MLWKILCLHYIKNTITNIIQIFKILISFQCNKKELNQLKNFILNNAYVAVEPGFSGLIKTGYLERD